MKDSDAQMQKLREFLGSTISPEADYWTAKAAIIEKLKEDFSG